MVGGPGHIVEIDEHHLVTRKYHRGRGLVHEQQWVWGAKDTTDGTLVIRRLGGAATTNENLLALIAANIRPHSIIWTDGRYRFPNISNGIIQMDMHSHSWVNHRRHFVSHEVIPGVGHSVVTTNHVENLWGKLDKWISSYQSDDTIDGYIDQFIYFRNMGEITYGEKFGRFLYDMAIAFPGPQRKPDPYHLLSDTEDEDNE